LLILHAVMLVLPCWPILVQPSTESVSTRVNIGH
jgi:hypothetical protein